MTTTVTQGNHQNWSMVIYCQNIVLDKGTISVAAPLFFSTITLLQQIPIAMLRENIKKGRRLSSFYPAACLFCLKAIFAAGVLNFCVRDGYRCVHSAIATGLLRMFPQNRITVIYYRLVFPSVGVLLVIKPSTY